MAVQRELNRTVGSPPIRKGDFVDDSNLRSDLKLLPVDYARGGR